MSPEPAPPPLPEPAVLALQRTAGNQATARFLQRQPTAQVPNLTSTTAPTTSPGSRSTPGSTRSPREVRQREAGSPIQSIAELVYMACELEYTDQTASARRSASTSSRARSRATSSARAKQQGITLLDHRDLDDVRGLQAEATAILGNLGRLPTELTFGNDNENITISIGGKLEANVGALHLEGETLPGGRREGQRQDQGQGRRGRGPRLAATGSAPRSSTARPRSASTSARASRPRSRPAT